MITDRLLAGPRPLLRVALHALEAGAPSLQLRNKGESARELLALGRDLRALTREAGALLFVNDRLDVALALEADGVHLGPDDMPIAAARRAVGDGLVIGHSCDDPERAVRAVSEGADYIGCGTLYATTTKVDAGRVIGLEGLARVVRAVDVPVVGIGGIHAGVASAVAGTGAAGIAVVGAVMAAEDPAAATRELLDAFASGAGGGDTTRPPRS